MSDDEKTVEVARKLIPIPFNGKASKTFVRHLISTGRYTINTLDGTPITDWTRLFADLEDGSALAALDGTAPMPIAEMFVPTEPPPKIPKPAEPIHPYLVLGGVTYTIRQLEHFGDAIIALVCRVMVHEKTGTEQRLYFNFTGQLIRNDVLGHGDVQKGTQVEIEVGSRFVEAGIDVAMARAREIISKTKEWDNLINFLESKSVIPRHYICSGCGKKFPANEPQSTCACGARARVLDT